MIKSNTYFWFGAFSIFVGFLNFEVSQMFLGFITLFIGVVSLFYGLID